MRSQILFFSALLIFFLPAPGYAEESLEVVVVGLEGRLLDNVMARLRINVFKRNSELNEVEIRRLHRLAPADIKGALAPFGLYSVSVESSLKMTDSGWRAHYLVDQGEPVYITSVDVSVIGEGADLAELRSPEALFDVAAGEPLDQPRYEREKRRLLRALNRLGFLEAAFATQEIRVNRKEKTAVIELVLDSGKRFLFGETSSDQDIISDDLLQRFLPWEPGDFFDGRKLHDLQRDLNRTDYFSFVTVEADKSSPGERRIPVIVNLLPPKTYNRYSFGVGYATDTRAHVRFEWQNKLVNKHGHRFKSSFLVGEQESYCVVNYGIPVADPRYNSLGLNGLWNREEWEDTITSSLSAGVVYEYLTDIHHVGVSLEALDEDYRVGDTKGDSQLLIPGIQGSWALADSVINTENGLRTSIRVSGANEEFLSDANFLKIRADGRLILTPVENWRLIGRGTVGTILINSINDIPPSLRFYAGGQNSVRGYRYRTLGPTDSSGTVIGGEYLITGSIEFERRLTELWRVVGFYDVGNAMIDPDVELAHGIGVGVGLALPFGQVRLEAAYPLNDAGSSQYFYLNVGADL